MDIAKVVEADSNALQEHTEENVEKYCVETEPTGIKDSQRHDESITAVNRSKLKVYTNLIIVIIAFLLL